MRIFAEELDGRLKQPGNVVLIIDRREAVKLVELVAAVAELKPREVLARKHKLRAKKLNKETQHIPCF